MTESSQNSIKYYLSPKTTSKKTLVLDLDETLVHSQFIPFSIKSDLLFKIELENQLHDIHVLIRPGVQKFLQKMGKLFEIVIFTASVSKYADPLLDIIDRNHNCSCRLFREHCSMVGITYIKDLKKLGRDLKDIIIVDNSPLSYSLNHENGLPILTWFNDKNDRELYKITPILEFLSNVYDVREYIKQIVLNDAISYDNAIKVIENFSKSKHDDSNMKLIEEIIYNKNNYNNSNTKLNDNIKENYSYDENEQITINNNTTDKKDKKNYVNITISNNAINNYLYFSPIYNINNNQIENNIPGGGKKILINNNFDNNIEVKINPKLIHTKEKRFNTKTMRTKSKGLINKITITKKTKNKNKSNIFKKIKYINSNINNKNRKEKINSAGNKSINYCIHMNNSEIKELNLNQNILDLKTIIPGKKNNSKDYKLPKTPEIEEILSPIHERMSSCISNSKTFNNLNKKIFKTKRGNSNDKKKNEKYKFRNNLYKLNNQINPSSIINHEKHKSFNYYTPFNFEHNMINSLKKNNLNNYAFFEQISNHTCKNNSNSNHKFIKGIKQNKINNNNLSLNLINKNYGITNDLNNQIKKNNLNKKYKLINNNHKKALSNQFKIIGITEYSKPNKIKKLINYNLIIQTSNSISNSNYKKINSTNRTINTENSCNHSIQNYKNDIGYNNFRTINNNNLNRTNQLINNKKLFNNLIFKNKNNIKRYKTNTNQFFNYDNLVRHKKTLSFNGTGINSYKIIKRTNSSSFSKENKNLRNKKDNHKEININNTNIINNSKNKNIIKTKREINDALINKKLSNKIARIKEIKFINIYEKIINKNNNKININAKADNIINNLIGNNNTNLNKLKKYVKIGVKKIVND